MSDEHLAAVYVLYYKDQAKQMLQYDNFDSAIKMVDKVNLKDIVEKKAGSLYGVDLKPEKSPLLRRRVRCRLQQ